MWTFLFFLLFAATLTVLIFMIQSFTRRIAELEQARVDIETEEGRVFDFLHGLGEAFSEGVRSTELYRLVVEGAVRILDAHGGALYVASKNDEALSAGFISVNCPVFTEVPDYVRQQAETTPVALQSFLKLQTIRRGEGLVGEVWDQQAPRLVTHAQSLTEGVSSNQADSVMLAPLVYRRKVLGVLVLANGVMSTPFSKKDFEVFRTITEQSAFALYTEFVYVEANEKRRLDRDLQIASEIQSILLPTEAPRCEGYEITGLNIPARQVSGDYFDYLHVDENHKGVVIADVSGKGVPASLIMAMCRSTLRSQASGNLSAADVLRRVNRQLYPDIKEDMFISMAYLIIEANTNKVTMARAGHDPPLLCRATDRSVEPVKPSGMALGIDSGDVFDRVCTDFTFEMEPDDCLLLYTDGSTEALDDKGLEFGLERLTQGLQVSASKGAAAVIRRLSDDIRSFAGTVPQYDDITLIAICKK